MRRLNLPPAVSLGLLSAIGLFAIDIYLPALPLISTSLAADSRLTQLSLTTFFVAMALCQVIYGPISDMFGRKRPLYVGLVVFIVGAVGCALAPTIEWLITFRFIQGAGACAGLVTSRAVVRDLFTGPAAAELMSRLMLVFSVSPIVAPLVGSIVIAVGDWRSIFYVMAAAALIGLLIAAFALDETRPAEKRAESSIASAFRAYGTLLRDPHYLGLVLVASFGMSSYMIYVSNSSFVLIERYGLTPSTYSIVFSINAVAFIGMSQMNGFLSRRFGLTWVIKRAVVAFATVMVAHALARAIGFDSLPVMATFLFIGYGCLGLVVPSAAVLALDGHGKIAGTASALMGTVQFVTSAVVVGCGSLVFDGTSWPMVAIIACCAMAAATLALVTLRRHARVFAIGE
ncbi:MAG: multidrug effflux MFS transporter [Ancalomicrobiaceae bacterium]|nr:multidrug effflux MFS transporter [Ancalomicrobiaceae bacterium]